MERPNWLPDKDHPAWKIGQTLAFAVLVGVLAIHGEDGGHAASGKGFHLDLNDLLGAGGVAGFAKLWFQKNFTVDKDDA